MSLLDRIRAQTSADLLDVHTSAGVVREAKKLLLPYHFLGPATFAVDFILVIAASLFAGIFYHWAFLGYVPALGKYSAVGLLVFANVSAILGARGDYRIRNLLNINRQIFDLILIWTTVFLLVLGVAFSLKVQAELSRGATLFFFAVGLSGTIVSRLFFAQFIRHALKTGAFAERRIILIGEKRRLAASPAILEIQRCGYRPVRTVEISERQIETAGISRGLNDTLAGVIETARAESVEDIFLLLGWEHSFIIESIVQILSVLPASIHLLPDENVAQYLNRRMIDLGATWGAEVKRAPLTIGECFLKRSFDVIGGCTALILLSPLMLLTGLLIKIDSSGTVFFFQTRNGFNDRSFRIVKFRTMHVMEDGQTIHQAKRGDPRVTRIGRWLRRANIDELPQLFNVVRGEMSLIGPRPHAAAHNDEYEKLVANYAFRHHVKPGMTGWAQVNGYRGATPTVGLMAKRVELDLWYINNWSFWLDIRIILRTLILGLQPNGY